MRKFASTLSSLCLACSAFAALPATPLASSYTIESGTTDYITSDYSISSGGSLTINGTLSMTSAAQYGLIIKNGSSLILGSGGSFVAPESTSVYSTKATNIASYGSIIVEKGASIFQNAKIVNYGYLEINEANVMKGQVSGESYNAMYLSSVLTDGRTKLNASQNFIIDVRNNGAMTVIRGADDAVLTLSNFAINSNGIAGTIVLSNFDKNSLFIEKTTTVVRLSDDFASLIVTNGANTETFSFREGDTFASSTAIEKMALEEVYDNGVLTGYWLYDAALVPEPSTYAAVFGALALCLAFMRRRK